MIEMKRLKQTILLLNWNKILVVKLIISKLMLSLLSAKGVTKASKKYFSNPFYM
jgi:hypothetical protein